MKNNYRKMWEDFGRDKSTTYSGYKFEPVHRVGLTNYLRENVIYEYLNPQKSDIVLDAGCAAGRQLFQVALKIRQGYGTDISKNFIDQANKLNHEREINNLSFQQAEVESLPFENNFFDKVICAEVLEHVIDEDKALQELKRTLKPGGVLIISVPHLNADATLWGRVLRFLRIRTFEPLENFTNEEIKKHGDAHVREFSKERLENWVQSHGFDVESVSNVSYIDGPGFDFILKFPLHVTILRKAIIELENLLNRINLPFGRHLVVKAINN